MAMSSALAAGGLASILAGHQYVQDKNPPMEMQDFRHDSTQDNVLYAVGIKSSPAADGVM